MSKFAQFKRMFLENIPVEAVKVFPNGKPQRTFSKVGDANLYVIDVMNKLNPNELMSYGEVRILCYGGLSIAFEIQHPKEVAISNHTPTEMREQMPEELLDNLPMEDYLSIMIFSNILFTAYKNHFKAEEIFPKEFRSEFYRNIAESAPNSDGKTIDSLSDEVIEEYFKTMDKAIILTAKEYLDGMPPSVRREFEFQYDLPKETKGEGFKFYNEKDFV